MMRRPLALLALTSALAFAPDALAQDASSQAAAQALFEQARQLMTDGRYAEACPKLAESQRLDPGAGTLLNLGHCYEKNGQTASAWVTFKDAAAAADLKHRDDWSSRARERSAALVPILSKLTIDVPPEGRPEGLQVRRDGVNVGGAEWGVPIPVDPGEHTIEALAPGKKKWTTKVSIGKQSDQQRVTVPGLETEQTVSVTPVPPPPESAPQQPPPPGGEPPAPVDTSVGSGQRTAGLVVGGVGVAGVVVGSIFGFSAMSKNSNSKDECPTTTCTNPQGKADADDAKSAATLSSVFFIGGVALAAGGAVLYFTAPKSKEVALHVAPQVGWNSAGVSLGGAW
jgi:serine/threonine-protein kinase